jgi:tetratricopeptide (TPR) repeat protein
MSIHLLDSLGLPDHPRWQACDDDYSAAVARALIDAYEFMASRSDRVASYLKAHEAVFPFRNARMAVEQRVRVSYVLGKARAANNEYRSAIDWLDRALEVATLLHARRAQAELYYLRGTVHRAINGCDESAADHLGCLDVLDDLRERCALLDAALEFDARVALAAMLLMLGRYPDAREHLEVAEPLLPYPLDSGLRSATLSWMRALVYRWDERPDRALVYAQAAAAAYAVERSPQAGRLSLIAADCALDLAVLFPRASQPWVALVEQARSAAEGGLSLARAAGDESGEEVALLSVARVDRMTGRNIALLPTLESVVYTAERLDDISLVVQAQTALGDELATREYVTSALNVYDTAVRTAERSQVPAMGVWASRALARLSDHS